MGNRTPFRLLRTKPQDVETITAGTRVGAAWYSESDWHRVREIASDPERLEPTYADWCRMFENALRHMAQRGLAVERVPIPADALESWCQQHKRPVDAEARCDFACELMRTQS